MTKQTLRAATLLGSLALTACATMDQVTPVPAGTRLMNAEQVSALLAKPATFNNAIMGGLRYEFKPGGEVNYSMRMLPARKPGRWKLDGDRLCINVEGDPWECGDFYQISATRFYFNLRGYDEDYNTLDLQ